MTTTDTGAPQDAPDTDPDVDNDGEKDWKSEYEKLQRNSRKWEERARANLGAADELKKLREEHMTEQERAVAAAKAEALTEAQRSFGARLVEAEVRAAAAGRQVDVDALLDGLDRSRFVTDDGEVDRKKLTDWIDRVAPGEAPKRVDLGQGARGGKSAPDMNQLIRDRMRR